MLSIFGIGDSISLHYHRHLAAFLPRHVRYERQSGHYDNLDNPEGANSGDSSMVLDYLKNRLTDEIFRPNYLLCNCGLHDIKQYSNRSTLHVYPAKYRSNLELLVVLLKQFDIKLIWVTTTPVHDATHKRHTQEFTRNNQQVILYNAIANDVVHPFASAIVDLYHFTISLTDDLETLYIDHVHFTNEVRQLQAAYIAGAIQGTLSTYS